MTAKKMTVNKETNQITEEEVADIMQPPQDNDHVAEGAERFPEPETAQVPAKVHKVGDVIKTYVQNGIAYKRVVTETGTVDLKV